MAVKQIDLQKQGCQEVFKEVLVTRKLKHPNIVTYLERQVVLVFFSGNVRFHTCKAKVSKLFTHWQKIDPPIAINPLLCEAWQEIAFCLH